MATKTEIGNLSLLHLGITKRLSNLDSDTTPQANIINIVFDICRRKFIREFDFPIQTDIVTLNLIQECPNDEYRYEYQYPTGSVKVRRILSGIRNDSRQTRIHYRVVKGPTTKAIWTDQQDAKAEITVDETDTSIFDDDSVMALSFLIAYYIAPALTDGDPNNLGAAAKVKYEEERASARANAANEEQPEEDPEAENIRFRENDTTSSRGEDFTAFPSGFTVS